MTAEHSDSSGGGGSARPIFDPDQGDLVSRSDVTWFGPISTGSQGLPVANGRFGGPVWQSEPGALVMQFNHTDLFMFNDASSASKDHQNAGGGAIARVHVGFGASDVFDAATRQRLSLYDATLSVRTSGVHVDVVADMDSDVVVMRVTDERTVPRPITIDLTMVREAKQVWGRHTAVSKLTAIGHETNAHSKVIVLEQTIEEPCDTGIEVNDHWVSSAVALTVQGREVAETAGNAVGERDSLRLSLPAARGSFTIIIGGDSTMQRNGRSAEQTAVERALGAKDVDAIQDRSRAWWHDFWQRSYLYLPSRLQYERRQNYYLYLAAISGRGRYPSKYNGGVWIGEEDRRDWGSFYWNWNQDCLYQPLIAANHLELLDPLFSMREASFDQYRVAAEQLWGSTGIFIGETAGILGWETLPDDVADSLRTYFAFESPRPPRGLAEFTEKRNRFLPAWNWNVFDGESQASYVTHTMVATQETAEHYWNVYTHTKDTEWLREKAYPFIRGAADFYQSYGGLRKEADGKYHFHNTNLHEHIWAGKDVIDDLALARGVFAVAIYASTILGTDEDRREGWAEVLDHLAPYPLRSDPGALWAASADPADADALATASPAWAQGIEPAYSVRGLDGTESPIFKMLEKYDLLNLETRDQSLDAGEWAVAVNTFLHSPGYLHQVEGQVVDRNGSSRFHVDAARLGRAQDLARILRAQYGVFSTYGEQPNLLFDQGDYYSAEGYATFTAALQEALNQSLSPTPTGDPVIRVFPAWPREWDAKYKLLAKDGFLVSSSMESGDIQYVEMESRLGETARVRNPWESDVVLYREGIPAERIHAGQNDILTFPTSEGEHIVLVRKGTDPATYRSSHLADATETDEREA